MVFLCVRSWYTNAHYVTTWTIKILKKGKKPVHIIILCMFTINDNQMIYRSWGMECDEQNCLSFWTLLSTFTPTVTTWKIKLLKKVENTCLGDIIILHVYHIWKSYNVRFLIYGAQWSYFFVILDHFEPFYPTNNPKNRHLKKKGKNPGDTIILHMRLINDRHFCHFGPFFAHLPP